MVALTVPPTGVSSRAQQAKAWLPVRISKPAGGVTVTGPVRLVPLTVKLLAGAAAPLAMLPKAGTVASEVVSVGVSTTGGAETVTVTGALRPVVAPHVVVVVAWATR